MIYDISDEIVIKMMSNSKLKEKLVLFESQNNDSYENKTRK